MRKTMGLMLLVICIIVAMMPAASAVEVNQRVENTLEYSELTPSEVDSDKIQTLIEKYNLVPIDSLEELQELTNLQDELSQAKKCRLELTTTLSQTPAVFSSYDEILDEVGLIESEITSLERSLDQYPVVTLTTEDIELLYGEDRAARLASDYYEITTVPGTYTMGGTTYYYIVTKVDSTYNTNYVGYASHPLYYQRSFDLVTDSAYWDTVIEAGFDVAGDFLSEQLASPEGIFMDIFGFLPTNEDWGNSRVALDDVVVCQQFYRYYSVSPDNGATYWDSLTAEKLEVTIRHLAVYDGVREDSNEYLTYANPMYTNSTTALQTAIRNCANNLGRADYDAGYFVYYYQGNAITMTKEFYETPSTF